jgi:hypothetical protein
MLKVKLASSVFHGCKKKKRQRREFSSPVRNVLTMVDVQTLLASFLSTFLISACFIDEATFQVGRKTSDI